MALEDDLRERRQRIAAATTRKARTDADLESARERLKAAEDTLRTEHGVETVDQGKKKLVELKGRLDSMLADADEKLEAAGA